MERVTAALQGLPCTLHDGPSRQTVRYEMSRAIGSTCRHQGTYTFNFLQRRATWKYQNRKQLSSPNTNTYYRKANSKNLFCYAPSTILKLEFVPLKTSMLEDLVGTSFPICTVPRYIRSSCPTNMKASETSCLMSSMSKEDGGAAYIDFGSCTSKLVGHALHSAAFLGSALKPSYLTRSFNLVRL